MCRESWPRRMRERVGGTTTAEKCLPMTWCFVRVSAAETYTFRWGRGSGEITVHRGDVRGEHHDRSLVDRIPVGKDWINDEDVRAQARFWLHANVSRPLRKAE